MICCVRFLLGLLVVGSVHAKMSTSKKALPAAVATEHVTAKHHDAHHATTQHSDTLHRDDQHPDYLEVSDAEHLADLLLPAIAPKHPANLVTLDRIEAVIFGRESTEIITRSDMNRLGFDGKPKTKDELIVERLIFQDAIRYRILADEKSVDDFVHRVAKSHGGTVQDIYHMFQELGYSPAEGRTAFARMYAVQQVIDHKVRSHIFIPDKDVTAYYNAYPLKKSASYIFERAVVPVPEGRDDEIYNKIITYRLTGRGLVVGWHVLPEVEEHDLAQSMKAMINLKQDEISEPRRTDAGFELFRLRSIKPEGLVSLEDRYREITEILRQPKFEEQLELYKKELLEHASVLIL